MLAVEYVTDNDRVRGWRYLWAKRVDAFNASKHCAGCFVGEYATDFGKEMPVNDRVRINLAQKPGEVFYFCGVSSPYKWDHNFHLAGVIDPAAPVIEVPMYHGDYVRVHGLRRVKFTDAAARERFPDRASNFLTCRNFQFAAHRPRTWSSRMNMLASRKHEAVLRRPGANGQDRRCCSGGWRTTW
jgi:hypothetical protein